MALKRQQPSNHKDSPPAKRPRNFKPDTFYDRLSKIHLTHRALREFNRRNAHLQPQSLPTAQPIWSDTDLGQFARHGGPDLSSLRGCRASSMPRRSVSGRRTAHSATTQSSSTRLDSTSSESADSNFEQNLIDSHIYPHGFTFANHLPDVEPANINTLKRRLEVPRASLSPSRRNPSHFNKFRRINATSRSDSAVMTNVLPFLRGDDSFAFSTAQDLLFTNIDSVTDRTNYAPKPDLFDGVPQVQVDAQVRMALDHLIIPTEDLATPQAPNFFFEAKSIERLPTEGERQLAQDLAVGARAMDALREYGSDTVDQDGNAYTIGATYHGGGQLKLYSAHTTTDHTGQTGTYITELDSYAMTGASHWDGIRAFRNGRDMAKEFRDEALRMANSRAREAAEHEQHHTQDDNQDESADSAEYSTQSSTSVNTITGEGLRPAASSPSHKHETRSKKSKGGKRRRSSSSSESDERSRRGRKDT
ncbi:hypothetical protein VPNG_07370 [Cytospora leucostoma]|uniref:Uncharacterized protein n=1 Tax=Cytospora leucostoma TaxID=1230097 RepID=A0A423WUS2_9PEZI|nr:hypothetical protein VPNG_07370 [Cytospora leucostoma]